MTIQNYTHIRKNFFLTLTKYCQFPKYDLSSRIPLCIKPRQLPFISTSPPLPYHLIIISHCMPYRPNIIYSGCPSITAEHLNISYAQNGKYSCANIWLRGWNPLFYMEIRAWRVHTVAGFYIPDATNAVRVIAERSFSNWSQALDTE